MFMELYFLIGITLIFAIGIFFIFMKYSETATKNFNRIPSDKDRRIHTRHSASLKIRYKEPLSESEGVSWAKDVSKGGMRLFLVEDLKIGSLLSLEITLPYDNRPVIAKSSIVWVRGDEAGLSFEDIKSEDLNRIFQYLTHKSQIRSFKIQ